MIVVDVPSGLGDRMLAIDFGINLARDLDRPLCVPWLIGASLGARFDQLFEAEKLKANFIDFYSYEDITSFISSRKPSIVLDRTSIPWSEESTQAFRDKFRNIEWLRGQEVVVVRSYESFYSTEEPFKSFVPRKHLREQIDDIAGRFIRTAGVHIRRTDNVSAITLSKTEYYLNIMEQMRDTFDNFFVATDDPHEEELLRDRFTVIAYDKRSLDRSTVEGMEDAVIDLYCLASTKYIIGSHASSFTEVAAQIKGILLKKAELL